MKTAIMTVGMLLAAGTANAIAPMWVRDARISPDGKRIAFSYKGDIYTVPFSGGKAQKITSGDAYEASPVWSPDGRKIAYTSDRNKGVDLYIMEADGSAPLRLTYNSAAETPYVFTPDGNEVIFGAVIQDPASSALFPSRVQTELYAVSAEGGRIRRVIANPAANVAMLPDGSFLYEDVKGLEDKWRKHHTSSVTRDIWKYDPASGKYTNLTARAGEDREPSPSVNGKDYYFLSERDGGSFNVYSASMTPGAPVRKLTGFTTHPVRFLSAGAGDRLAFVYNGELYTMTPGSAPQKLNVDVADTDIDDINDVPFSRASGAKVSPDGKQVAFTARGEV